MCSGGSQTQTTSIPSWLEKAGQDIYGSAKSFYEKGYQPYTGQRVADFNTDQTSAFGGVRDFVTNPGATDQTANAAYTVGQGAAQGASQVSNPQRSYEGIENYINPYVQASLQPTLRTLQETATSQQQANARAANMAGAFGDARQGVMDSNAQRNQQLAAGEAAGTAYSDAFKTGLAQSSTDIGRQLEAEQANANLQEAAANRHIAGGQALQEVGQAGQTQALERYASLLGIGQQEQQHGQSQLDAQYEAYQNQQQDAYDKLAALMSVLGGVPYSRTQKTTNQASGTSVFSSILGSLLGAAFKAV